METQILADVKHSCIFSYLKKSIGCELTVCVNCCDDTVVAMGEYVRMEHWWDNHCDWRKTCPTATLSSTRATWTAMEMKLDLLHVERWTVINNLALCATICCETTPKQHRNTHLILQVCFWLDSPQWGRASSFTRFLDHTQ